jgi:hypothetical protein
MMDLQERLGQIAGPAERPTIAQIEADLSRGRRALRRRRTTQTGAGSALGVAALVTAFTLANTGVGAGSHTAAIGDRPAAGAHSSTVLRLAAYKGAQPKGFTVDTVPDGWYVQSDNRYNLLIAPERAKHPGPGVDPSKAPVYDPSSYVDKIGITLSSRDNGHPRPGSPVKVGDRDGVLVKSERGMTPDGPAPTAANGDPGWTIWVKQPSGVYLIVQFWQGLALGKGQMIEIAAGVHVHKEALRAAG